MALKTHKTKISTHRTYFRAFHYAYHFYLRGAWSNGGKLYRSDQGILDRRSRIIMIFWSCGIVCPGSISYNIHKTSRRILYLQNCELRIVDDILYPQFAERICEYPWILGMLPQSNLTLTTNTYDVT